MVTPDSRNKMSCNGCRVLRKGCSDTCVLRQCLKCIGSAEAQAHATLFVTKFFGRAGLTAFINGVSESQRPALFQSLLYEACGRHVNPVYGAVGLLYSGKWNICQTAVETVLKGGTPEPLTLDDVKQNDTQSSFNTSSFQTCFSSMAPPAVESFVTSSFGVDDRHLGGPIIDHANSNDRETKPQIMQRLKRKWVCDSAPDDKKIRSSNNQMLDGRLESCSETISRVNLTSGLTTSGHNLSVTGYESGGGTIGKVDLVHIVTAAHDPGMQGYDDTSSKVDSRLKGSQSEPFIDHEHCTIVNGLMRVRESDVNPIAAITVKPRQINDDAALMIARNSQGAALDSASCFDTAFTYHSDDRNNNNNNTNTLELDLSLKTHTHTFTCLSEKRLESKNLRISSPGSVNSEASVTGLHETTSDHIPKQEFKLLQLL